MTNLLEEEKKNQTKPNKQSYLVILHSCVIKYAYMNYDKTIL